MSICNALPSTPPLVYNTAMQRLELKPTHKPVQNYYSALRQFDDLGVTHETAVRSAFQGLLDHCARQHDWTLVPETTASQILSHAACSWIPGFVVPVVWFEELPLRLATLANRQ